MENIRCVDEFVSSEKTLEVIVGVLAVQGSFAEHVLALNRLNDGGYLSTNFIENDESRQNINIKVLEIRSSRDVHVDMHGLVIPGGESTTLNIFLKDNGFFDSIQRWIR